MEEIDVVKFRSRCVEIIAVYFEAIRVHPDVAQLGLPGLRIIGVGLANALCGTVGLLN